MELSEGLVDVLRARISAFEPKLDARQTGRVLAVADGIATVLGLDHVTYGEEVIFEDGTSGMALSLEREQVGVVIFGDGANLREGMLVRRGGRPASVPCSNELIGRVVNPLGQAIDGGAPLSEENLMPVEREALGVVTRKPVSVPLKTGILAVDSMVPIGRGQRELIIGDRQTGKTTLALDTILNQKGKNVVCIYVAIGQKASSVAKIYATLKEQGALDYSFVLCSTASDGPSLQYLAPYSATAMGEYFMLQGRDVLIVYDDLSKHAVAYRALSLLLRRSPGREAYPGDVFYLHSRLLERSCRLEDKWGGGSMTALPIIETQAGDVSAYIPTNVISITDGQIYLESSLFHSGIRPAINTGLSVSRVGGSAQSPAVRQIAGTLRVGLARFSELEVFSQFAGDLDEATRAALAHGRRLVEVLKQPPRLHYTTAQTVLLLYLATGTLLDSIPLAQVRDALAGFCTWLGAHDAAFVRRLEEGEKLTDEDKSTIERHLKAYLEGEGSTWLR